MYLFVMGQENTIWWCSWGCPWRNVGDLFKLFNCQWCRSYPLLWLVRRILWKDTSLPLRNSFRKKLQEVEFSKKKTSWIKTVWHYIYIFMKFNIKRKPQKLDSTSTIKMKNSIFLFQKTEDPLETKNFWLFMNL